MLNKAVIAMTDIYTGKNKKRKCKKKKKKKKKKKI
jgi:hypothetical protein